MKIIFLILIIFIAYLVYITNNNVINKFTVSNQACDKGISIGPSINDKPLCLDVSNCECPSNKILIGNECKDCKDYGCSIRNITPDCCEVDNTCTISDSIETNKCESIISKSDANSMKSICVASNDIINNFYKTNKYDAADKLIKSCSNATLTKDGCAKAGVEGGVNGGCIWWDNSMGDWSASCSSASASYEDCIDIGGSKKATISDGKEITIGGKCYYTSKRDKKCIYRL